MNTSNYNQALDKCKSMCGTECNNILIKPVLEGGYDCYRYKNRLDVFSPHLSDMNYGTSYYKDGGSSSCKLNGVCCGVITSKGEFNLKQYNKII